MQRRFHHGKTITADRNKRFDDSTVRCTGSRRPVGGVIRFRQPLPLPRASRPSGERRKGLMRKAGNLRCRPSSFITVTTVWQASRTTSQPLVNHGRALRNIADQHRRPSSFISIDRGFAGIASHIAACGGPRSTIEEYRRSTSQTFLARRFDHGLQASRITSQPLVSHGRALRNFADQHRRPSSFISIDRGFAGIASHIAACGGPRSTIEEYR